MKRFIAVLFVLVVGFSVFASGSTESSTAYSYSVNQLSYEPVTEVNIAPSADVISFFTDNDISADLLNVNPNQLSASDVDGINEVIEDNYEELVDGYIMPQLRAELSYGGTELAYMILGTYEFSAQIDSFHS